MNVVTKDITKIGNIRILIVDDNDDVRQALISFISLSGDIEVVGEAIDGVECLKKAAELEPDIIIMDEKMPGINGLEATRIISESTLSSKVIMLTNYDDFESEAYKCGVAAYFIKGVKLDIFLDCIRRVHQGEINKYII